MTRRRMKALFPVLLSFAILADSTTLAQRSRRPVRKEEPPSPVRVTRAATLRVSISTDSVTIFEYLSDAKKLQQWFPDQAIMEAQLGGKYHFRWKDAEGVWTGVVTQYIRGNILGYTWEPPGETTETNVQFKLFPQGAETLIELTHSGFDTNEAMDKEIKAWDFYLQNLKSLIEQGTDTRPMPKERPARARPRR